MHLRALRTPRGIRIQRMPLGIAEREDGAPEDFLVGHLLPVEATGQRWVFRQCRADSTCASSTTMGNRTHAL
jgi:hypothetical protein